MGKWRFKSCPRCGGDLFVERDLDKNWYEQCLQCAYRHEVANTEGLKEQPVHQGKKTPVASGARD